MRRILISFSGGRTSAYMCWWMLRHYNAAWNPERHCHVGFDPKTNEEIEFIVVFANTGKEREETLIFVDQCDREFDFHVVYIEAIMHHHGKGAAAKIVTFETCDRTGNVFESIIAKHGIPNPSFLHCTREMKAAPIRSYAKSIGWKKYLTAIGIRADEPKRLDWIKSKKERLIYPLALENRCTRHDVAHFWSIQAFDLQLTSYQGNCDLCWKKSKRKLLTILTENDTLANWWLEMEQKYEWFIPASRQNQIMQPPIRFYRQNESILDLMEESNLPFPKSLDESKEANRLLMMRDWNEDLDGNSGCQENCEVF